MTRLIEFQPTRDVALRRINWRLVRRAIAALVLAAIVVFVLLVVLSSGHGGTGAG
jgi:hypothetical protein